MENYEQAAKRREEDKWKMLDIYEQCRRDWQEHVDTCQDVHTFRIDFQQKAINLLVEAHPEEVGFLVASCAMMFEKVMEAKAEVEGQMIPQGVSLQDLFGMLGIDVSDMSPFGEVERVD